jgi:uncharacterized membrane protein YhaH (DUF805 family)
MSAPYDPYGQGYGPGYGQPGYGQGPYGPMPQGPYLPPGYGGPYGPGDYLRGAPVGFTEAVRQAFRHAFTYQGRASRSAYWWFALFEMIALIGVIIVAAIINSAGGSGGAPIVAPLLALVIAGASVAMLVVSLPLYVRRLHDSDLSGFWLFIALVPFAGGIALFVLCLLPGTRGPNRFG